MTEDAYPGEFEQMLLLAILRLDDDAYGASLMRELEATVGRRVSRGSVYVTLDRMEAKGWLRSAVSAPLPERGGRPRRLVTLTQEGLACLRRARRAWMTLWDGIEDVLDPA